MHRLFRLLVLMLIALPTSARAAEALYIASVASPVSGGAAQVVGNLYRVALPSSASTLIGPIRVDGTVPIGVTGLAEQPVTDTLYGITASSSPNYPNALVTIDPSNGEARLVGGLGAACSDIAFDPQGNLFAWMSQTRQLARVDLATGMAHPLGPSGLPGQPAGLAIDAKGRAYVIGGSGTLDIVDTTSGLRTSGPTLRGAPHAAAINSLTFTPTGELLAVNTNLGVPALAVLVKIDASTGQVTPIGPLPNDTDAMVFIDVPGPLLQYVSSRGGISLLAGLLIAVSAIAWVIASERRRPPPRDP